MNKACFVTLVLAMAAATSAWGDGPTTRPIRYTWIVTSCETWNCAASALVLANGDKHVIALPTGHDERPWLILKRVEEGSIFIPEDEPFACELFDDVGAAGDRFRTVNSCQAPMMLNVPDGRAVVISLHQCGSGKRRSVH
jgi:hypothetical protein